MSEHTPGPWYDSGPHEAYDGDHSIGSVDIRVAQVVRDGLDDQEGAANARLIAAAPELLAVCQKLAQWGSHEDFEEEITAARAAIAKATGANR